MIYPGDLCIALRNIVLLKDKRMVNQYHGIIFAKSFFIVISIENLKFNMCSLYVMSSSTRKSGWIYDINDSFKRIC